MILSKSKTTKSAQYLSELPKLSQQADDIQTLYSPKEFQRTLLAHIKNAQKRIHITALYLEQDEGGQAVLQALYQAKKQRPELEVSVFVDWHRAQRGRIGAKKQQDTNAHWYYELAQQYSDLNVPIYGAPVNTREALGVLHLKGFIIDDTLIYSGASLNDVYLHQQEKYRYDRYYLFKNQTLTDSMISYLQQVLLGSDAVQRLDNPFRPKKTAFKNAVRRFRRQLRVETYHYSPQTQSDSLSITPLVGLGKNSTLNKTIDCLISSAKQELILCTPYFNLPALLVKHITRLLRNGVTVEIIVGDKTANDFYIPPEEQFRIIGALPYLYEINLRRFMQRLQPFIDQGSLKIRIWKEADNSFHLKGVWVDKHWQLVTGSNLNPRAWHLDLENGILIADPEQQLSAQQEQELTCIRRHTSLIKNYQHIQELSDYPTKAQTIIKRLHRMRIDRLINRIL